MKEDGKIEDNPGSRKAKRVLKNKLERRKRNIANIAFEFVASSTNHTPETFRNLECNGILTTRKNTWKAEGDGFATTRFTNENNTPEC